MKTKNSLRELAIGLISIVPFLYYLYLWSSMSEIIPIHFDFEGNPDNYGNRTIIGVGLLFFSIGFYFFFKFIPKIYKRNSFTMTGKTFDHLRLILASFFSALFIIIIHSMQQGKVNNTLIFISIALLISVLGNYMRNVRPNHFAGNRFLWSNDDEASWKNTQNFIGLLWFFMGIIITILLFILPDNLEIYVFTIGIFCSIILIPIIYSMIAHSKNKTKITTNDQETYSNHWVGLFYFNPKDKRLLVPKRMVGMGWTINFGNPYSYLLIIVIIVIIIIL